MCTTGGVLVYSYAQPALENPRHTSCSAGSGSDFIRQQLPSCVLRSMLRRAMSKEVLLSLPPKACFHRPGGQLDVLEG